MDNQSLENRELVTEISKEIVTEIAPEELDIFDQLVRKYYENPQPPNLSVQDKDEMLGFGLGELLVPFTPAITAMVTVALGYIIKAAIDEFGKSGAEFAREKIQKIFENLKSNDGLQEHQDKPSGEKVVESLPSSDQKQASKREQLVLTPDQVKHVHKLALQELKRYGIAETKAKALADALLRRIIFSPKLYHESLD